MDDFPLLSTSSTELVAALSQGIIKSIQSSGRILPSSEVHASSPAQCQWTEYATVALQDGSEISMFYSPVVEDLRQFFPPLDGSEVGSDGRPLLYSACLGLFLSKRDYDIGEGKHSPLSTFLSVAKFLLEECKVDPNQPTLTKGACLRPPFHLVAKSCQPSAVAYLLSHGANVNLSDEEGWTALMAACMSDIPPFEEGGPTEEERVETIKLLLKATDDEGSAIMVNARNYCGYTALHYACEGLHVSLIRALLEDGSADATLRTVWGQSCVGIVQSRRELDATKARDCEGLLLSHLEKTGRLEEVCTFLEEEKKAIELMNLVEDVLIPASCRPESDLDIDLPGRQALCAQDKRIISALMHFLKLDPSALFEVGAFPFGIESENLYETIHRRILEIVPTALLQVYCNRNPSIEEREIITCTNYNLRNVAEASVDGARRVNPSVLMGRAFSLHRERGHVASQLELMTDLIVGPLQRTIAFGIPSNAVAKDIVARAPRILEMGAGTGYWSYVLTMVGADVIAFDAHPPSSLGEKILEDRNREQYANNIFVGTQTYFQVREGVASTVLDGSNPDITNRALLMVWPNNPDAEDNQHVAIDNSMLPPIWDLECLQKYHEMGGCTVIYVGEREEKIKLVSDATGSDCGFCSSRKFQQFLKEHFTLEVELECPRWWMKEDDVTIWMRK